MCTITEWTERGMIGKTYQEGHRINMDLGTSIWILDDKRRHLLMKVHMASLCKNTKKVNSTCYRRKSSSWRSTVQYVEGQQRQMQKIGCSKSLSPSLAFSISMSARPLYFLTNEIFVICSCLVSSGWFVLLHFNFNSAHLSCRDQTQFDSGLD